MAKLNVLDCLRFGWETFKKRPGIFVLVAALYTTLYVAFSVGVALHGSTGTTETWSKIVGGTPVTVDVVPLTVGGKPVTVHGNAVFVLDGEPVVIVDGVPLAVDGVPLAVDGKPVPDAPQIPEESDVADSADVPLAETPLVEILLGFIQVPLTLSEWVEFVVFGAVFLGLLSFFIRAHDDVARVKILDLWNPQPFLYFLGASILLAIVTSVGLFLLIVPGLIAATGFFFCSWLVIDRGLTPINSLTESWRITKGNKWQVFLLLLVIVLISCAGLLVLLPLWMIAPPPLDSDISVLGVLLSWMPLAILFATWIFVTPIAMLALTHAYRTLASQA